MSIDSSVIAVIEAAVRAEPENVELRLHLASLLLKAGRAQEALDHCQKIFAARPDHAGALMCAAEASDALGDRQRAEGYRRIAGALAAPQDALPRERLPADAPGRGAAGRVLDRLRQVERDPADVVPGRHRRPLRAGQVCSAMLSQNAI
ncbi:MAG TPA: tetratricopeptide repeat protein, partial [Pyrinomonadaceae bacterium]|nr:tetratricopeptide repeat protein [Pyrinomonadaceae bacterium]